ncbi:MAG: hypothetical protein ABUL72_01380 [Armatimonadota bacterium]
MQQRNFDPVRFAARRLWWGMLWIIRRPSMRRLQRASVNLFPESRRAKVHESALRQERFARKYGLAVVTLSLNVLALSLLLTGTYALVTTAIDRGWIVMPSQERGL